MSSPCLIGWSQISRHEGEPLAAWAEALRRTGVAATAVDSLDVVYCQSWPYDDPARLMTNLAVPHGTAFAAELGHSVASLALSRADQPDQVRAQKVKEYRNALVHPYYAAERGLVDDVIDPRYTRAVLSGALEMLRSKHVGLPSRKHGNPPM